MKIKFKSFLALPFAALLGLSVFSLASCRGEADKISVLSREDGSGTRGAFVELVGIEKKDAGGQKVDFTTEEAAITNSTAVMLASVAGDRQSIGYVSLGSLNDSVKALQIDGVAASVRNIKAGDYKISRPFNIVVRQNLSPAAQDLVNFVLSGEGQKVVTDNKYIGLDGGENYASTLAAGKVVVSGSSSVSPVMEKLIEAYRQLNPNAQVELQSSDSTTGIALAINGTCDLGLASRSLKASEKAQGVREIMIALDGIAVIVNKANEVSGLTKAQVEEIFTGQVTRWQEVK